MERYYYDYRGSSGGRGDRPKVGGFLFPFILFIIIGVVLVLGVEIYFKFFRDDIGDAIVLDIVSGQAQVKLWGTSEFSKAYDGTKILPGDEVFVGQNSKARVVYPDGTSLRLNGDTDAVFESSAKIVLKKGEIWVDKTFSSSCRWDFSVLVKNILAKPKCGIFDISFYGEKEIARTVSGAMEVDVYSRNGGVVVDHVQIKEGERAVFDNKKLEKFWLFQAPNVVEAIGEDFMESNWYIWNVTDVADDAEEVGDVPQSFVDEPSAEESEPVVEESVGQPIVEEAEIVFEESEEQAMSTPDLGEFKDPIIVEVGTISWDYSMFEKGIEIKDSLSIKIIGKAYGADKIFINDYQLQKFVPSSSGEEIFTYWLEEKYGNLKVGENVYEVYSTAPDGTRSNSVYFKVIYTPPVVEEETNLPSE